MVSQSDPNPIHINSEANPTVVNEGYSKENENIISTSESNYMLIFSKINPIYIQRVLLPVKCGLQPQNSILCTSIQT